MKHPQNDDKRLRTLARALNHEMISFVMLMDATAPNTRGVRKALLEAALNVEIDISEVCYKRLATQHDRTLLHVRTMLDELSSLLYAVFQLQLMPAPIYTQCKLVIMQMKFLLPHSDHEAEAATSEVVRHAQMG